MFCRQTVAEVRRAAEARRGGDASKYPAVLFFFMGTPEQGADFFARHWPEARAVADPARVFYAAFGIERGGAGELIAPGVIARGFAALAQGHGVGTPVGDPWMMPGLVVVEGGRERWRHEFAHIGDHPVFADVPRLAGL